MQQPPVSLQALEQDQQNTYELPRDEDDNYLCFFHACQQPLRTGSREDYFVHLRAHQDDGHKLLANMINFAHPERKTVSQRRAELAMEPSMPHTNKRKKNDNGTLATGGDSKKRKLSPATTPATETSGSRRRGSSPKGATTRATSPTPTTSTSGRTKQRKVDVEEHGFSEAIKGIAEGEKINMPCPIEGCPKVITGFLYHLNSHLSAHRRAETKGQKLKVRKPSTSNEAPVHRRARGGRRAPYKRKRAAEPVDRVATADATAATNSKAQQEKADSAGNAAATTTPSAGTAPDTSNNGDAQPATDHATPNNNDAALPAEQAGDANVTTDSTTPAGNDGATTEQPELAAGAATATPSDQAVGSANNDGDGTGVVEELIRSDDPRWKAMSDRAGVLKEQVARYGQGLFRQDLKGVLVCARINHTWLTRAGNYVCFFENCQLRTGQSFSRHVLRHERENAKIDQKQQQ